MALGFIAPSPLRWILMLDRQFHILLVEDNVADAYLLRKALEAAELRFQLTILADGAAALEFVKGESQVPDLAVMDLNLPKNDGREVLEAIRTNQRFMKMPVVITSSSASPRDQAEVEALGITRYIQKPPNLEAFLQIGLILKEILTVPTIRNGALKTHVTGREPL